MTPARRLLLTLCALMPVAVIVASLYAGISEVVVIPIAVAAFLGSYFSLRIVGTSRPIDWAALRTDVVNAAVYILIISFWALLTSHVF